MTKYSEEIRKVRKTSKKVIPEILKKNKSTISALYEEIQKQNPELCNDEVKCECGRKTKRPEWKHQIQWAVADLKYNKKITYSKETGMYSLV